MPLIDMFGGLVPRLSTHKLPEGAATRAHNVKLRSGKLEAWREKLELVDGLAGVQSFAMHGCCPVLWNTCVHSTNFVPSYERMYLTGRATRPEIAIIEDCNPDYYWLGVPAPTSPPRVGGADAYNQTSSLVSYIYTFVNEDGEESAPSPVSADLSMQDGGTVTVMVDPLLAPGYRVSSVNIYRTGTGYRLGDEKEQLAATDYLLVGSVSIGQSPVVFADNVPVRSLGPACSTRETRVPPSSLRFLRHLVGTGHLVGATENGVHFSRRLQPWNWPAEFDGYVHRHIVNLVVWDRTVFVSTDGAPYVIQVPADGLKSRTELAVQDVQAPHPDISCGYANSALGTPFGMIYASYDGLVVIKPNGTWDILTASWFSTDDWKRLRPDTVRLAFWRGYLICVTDEISFMLEIDHKSYNDYQVGALTTISDRPLDLLVSPNGELLMLEADALWQWDAGDALRRYAWESRELSFSGGKASPTTAKVRTTGTTLRLLTKWETFYEREILDETPVRLGRLGRHVNYRLGFYGTGTVEFADLGHMEMTISKGA